MPELTYVEAARQALAEEMARDETIFVVGEGIGPRGGNLTLPRVSSTFTALSACATPRYASAASSACALARP